MTALTRDEIIVCLQKLNVVGITVYQQEGIRQACEIIAMPWQPIETAPKDGSDILCCRATFTPTIAYYEVSLRRWMTCRPEDFFAEDEWKEQIQGTDYRPTHWMPLPKAPT